MITQFLSNVELIDLTHTLHPEVPTWDGSCGFHLAIKKNYSNSVAETNLLNQSIEMHSGVGTHMDAPCHCFKGKIGIADIALTQLVLPLIVLNVSAKADANYQIDIADITFFENQHGRIPSDSLVIGYTGWSRYWNNPVKYRNPDAKGHLHFPIFHEESAALLLERGVAGIAIDTLSPDLGVDGRYPVHELFLGAGKYIVENVNNAHLLPATGAMGFLLPMKIKGGAEAPVRFIAALESL